MRRLTILVLLATSTLATGCATYNHTPGVRRAHAPHARGRARANAGEVVLTTFGAAATLTSLGLDIAEVAGD